MYPRPGGSPPLGWPQEDLVGVSAVEAAVLLWFLVGVVFGVVVGGTLRLPPASRTSPVLAPALTIGTAAPLAEGLLIMLSILRMSSVLDSLLRTWDPTAMGAWAEVLAGAGALEVPGPLFVWLTCAALCAAVLISSGLRLLYLAISIARLLSQPIATISSIKLEVLASHIKFWHARAISLPPIPVWMRFCAIDTFVITLQAGGGVKADSFFTTGGRTC